MDKKLKKLIFGEISLKRFLRSACIFYGLFFLFALFFSDRLIFQPHPSSYRDNTSILKLSAPDGLPISAIYLNNSSARYTLLYSHGNGEDLGDILELLQALRDAGFSVFSYDYHGYGTSAGKPSESNTYQDVDTAYEYLVKKLKIPPELIIAYGRSVGSGPTVDLVSRKLVAGMILQSPFVTAFRTLTRIPLLPFDRFRNIDKIPKIKCPILIIHGTADRVIPLWNGQEIFQKANEPKRYLWVDGAGHNDLEWSAGNKFTQAIREFADFLDS